MRTAVVPGQLKASVSGRWGARRVRTTEVYATITAERAYDVLLREAHQTLHAYARGDLRVQVDRRTFDIGWQVRPNRIWRLGRVFLVCPTCRQPATRLYVPTAAASPACRSCWSLTYESRQLYNYKNVGALKQLGLTSRNLAWRDTERRRTASRRAARERAARRRELPWWRAATKRT